jgi:hypothetical protein
MKIYAAGFVFCVVWSAESFPTAGRSRRQPFFTKSVVQTGNADFDAVLEAPVSPYEQIGIEKEALALGVDVDAVATYIGSKEGLIDRTLADIPSFTRAQAEAEVDKFLLDAEALNMMIQFNKMKAEDPDFVVPETDQDEGLFSFRNVVALYLVYVAGTSAPPFLRRWVAEKEAAGEWQGTNIPFIDDWLANTATAGADITSDAVQAVSDTVQAASDVLN